MSTIYFDGETIPTQDDEIIASMRADMAAEIEQACADIKAPGNYKDEAKIAEFIASKANELRAGFEPAFEDAYRKTAFDGGAGQIVVLSVAIDDDEVVAHRVRDLSLEEEARVLRDFFASVRRRSSGRPPVFVGHNIVNFDLPFIYRRAVVHGIRPPLGFPINPKPWADTVFDTMTKWAGDRGFISQDKLCRILGIEGKPGDIDGSKVWEFVKAGNIERVAEYCADDVAKVRQIHRRLTFTTGAIAEAA